MSDIEPVLAVKGIFNYSNMNIDFVIDSVKVGEKYKLLLNFMPLCKLYHTSVDNEAHSICCGKHGE